MASESTDTIATNDADPGPQSDTNEHDYAHTSAGGRPTAEASFSGCGIAPDRFSAPTEPDQNGQHGSSLSVDPAVGAEVDCADGNVVEIGPHPPNTEDNTGHAVTVPRDGRTRPKRPEDRNCSCCKSEFERRGRRFDRRAVYTFTTPDTVHWAFPGAIVHDKSFICETCAQMIRSKCKRKQTGKRPIWLKPPPNKQSESRDKKMKERRMGKKRKAALLVSKSCYKSAFKMLWSAKGARKHMMDFLSKQLKGEMKALSRQADSPFHQKVTSRRPLTSFPWRRCLNWAQDRAPLVTHCLRSLFPDMNALAKSRHQLSEEQAQMLLERRAVVALSIPLFTRNIWKNNFLQAALGAELRLQGCSGSALEALNTMGLCQNKDTVRLLLLRLRKGKRGGPTQNGRQRMKMKQEQLKAEQMADIEEDDEEEDEEEEEVGDEEDEEDEDEEEEMTQMELAVEEEEVEEEEVQDGVQEEDEEDEDEEEKEEKKRRRKKKAKKQRKEEEKKKERGKQRQEEEDDDEGPEQKKRRVVVVRLGLLKGHSEVGRSDLSAP
ncbi:uncharacterized protein LOC115420080 [Sphaeramia orbicularis]|uniref:uncharacterized protein LOC115420080 n=1 Tax=Sphaeramia orbicularis TaxID=375764 RepID=UPI00117F7698|nr:uncharacterized protein LOC115420080 [Sphaeramia orbicularis]